MQLVGLITNEKKQLLSLEAKMTLTRPTEEQNEQAGVSVLSHTEKSQMATIKQFKPGSDEPLSLSTTAGPSDGTNAAAPKKPVNVMAEIGRELYGIPKHLDVDTCKTNVLTNFADRTAQHIKSGLSEIVVEPSVMLEKQQRGNMPRVQNKNPASDNKDLTRSPAGGRGRNSRDKNLRKEIYK